MCSAVLRSFPGIALDTCHLPMLLRRRCIARDKPLCRASFVAPGVVLPMKYECVASNRKSPGSQMLRRLVSKFNVELPVGSPPDLFIPLNGDVTRQMDEKEQYFHTHLCKTSLPRKEVDLADMRSAHAWTLFIGFASLPPWPPCFPKSCGMRILRKESPISGF